MCGIVGVVSKSLVAPKILKVLKNLEYRGYDSAGLMLLKKGGEFERYRVCGRVKGLKDQFNVEQANAFVGIGHTRWATHGAPSVKNAHPHVVSNLGIVHNGIIENYQLLSQNLKDYAFSSETDTEHLLAWISQCSEKFVDKRLGLKKALESVQGQYAFLLVDQNQPDQILGASHHSSLVLGIGKNEYYLCSDVHAIASFIEEFVVIESGQMICINQNGYTIYDQSLQPVHGIIHSAKGMACVSDLGSYKHYMEKEISDQLSTTKNLLTQLINADQINESFFPESLMSRLGGFDFIQIVACGSSYHAGLFAQLHLKQVSGVYVSVDFASQFNDEKPLLPKNTLCIFISQSGETADTLKAVRYCKTLKHQPFILGVSNVNQSALANLSDALILMQSGVEVSVAATKTFFSQLVLLLFLSYALGRVRSCLDHQTLSRYMGCLKDYPTQLAYVLHLRYQIGAWAKHIENKQYVLFMARGKLYPIALEGALKLKEVSYICAEAYPAGELKHGPLALIEKGVPVICLVGGLETQKMISNISEVYSRGASLYVLCENGVDLGFLKDQCHLIELEAHFEDVLPLSMVVLLQYLALDVAVLKGLDVDKPRNLAKSVTVE